MANENDRARIYAEVSAEREEQEKQWGGDSHDDGHAPHHWFAFIERQISRARMTIIDLGQDSDDYAIIRERLVKVAALAVAGIESIDRTLDA